MLRLAISSANGNGEGSRVRGSCSICIWHLHKLLRKHILIILLATKQVGKCWKASSSVAFMGTFMAHMRLTEDRTGSKSACGVAAASCWAQLAQFVVRRSVALNVAWVNKKQNPPSLQTEPNPSKTEGSAAWSATLNEACPVSFGNKQHEQQRSALARNLVNCGLPPWYLPGIPRPVAAHTSHTRTATTLVYVW